MHQVVGPHAAQLPVAVHAIPHVVDVAVGHVTVHVNPVEDLGVARVAAESLHLYAKNTVHDTSSIQESYLYESRTSARSRGARLGQFAEPS